MLTWLAHLQAALWPRRNPPRASAQSKKDKASPEATQREKTTAITTRFWGNKIAEDRSIEVDERAFLARLHRMQQNDPPKIVPKSQLPFKPVFDAEAVMRQAFLYRGVTLPSSREMDKYLDQRPKRPTRRRDTSAYDA
jgi:hypothetical protein